MLVKSALRDGSYWGLWGRDPSLSAFSLDEDVASSTVAAESVKIIGRVGRADVTDGSDEVVTIGALTSLIFVFLILSADGVVRVELETLSVLHVVAEDADTLAENVVVYLVDGTGDIAWLGSWGRSVGAIGYE